MSFGTQEESKSKDWGFGKTFGIGSLLSGSPSLATLAGGLSKATYGPISIRNSVDPLSGWNDLMGAFMPKAPEVPAVAPAPAAPTYNDDSLKAAAKLEAERLRKRKGMKSTILTGDSTLMQPQAQTQKSELLG
jgi:hypothetical protein